MDNQDLISFASPNPAQKKGGAGQFQADLEAINFNNNDRTMEQKFKAVQNLFSTPSSEPPPPPPPRNSLVSPNGLMPPHPNLNRYGGGGGFPQNQSYQQNFTQTPSISYSINPPNQAAVVTSGGQSMFNQQSFYPPPSIHATNSLSIQSQNPNFNQQMGLQRTNSANGGFGPIPKSNSWNEEILTSTPKQQSSSALRHTSPPPSIASDARSSGSRRSLQYKKKSLKDSLIDLGPAEGDAANTTTVSILHDFDPLNESDNEEEEEEIYWSSQKSNFSESFYDTNDPFSYMEQQVSFCSRKIYHPSGRID